MERWSTWLGVTDQIALLIILDRSASAWWMESWYRRCGDGDIVLAGRGCNFLWLIMHCSGSHHWRRWRIDFLTLNFVFQQVVTANEDKCSYQHCRVYLQQFCTAQYTQHSKQLVMPLSTKLWFPAWTFQTQRETWWYLLLPSWPPDHHVLCQPVSRPALKVTILKHYHLHIIFPLFITNIAENNYWKTPVSTL